ncbi:MmgE/PrpD family protein [Thermodesulfobacteriota bacterium]
MQNILLALDDMAGKEECTVIGTPKRTAVVNAVLANGTLIRALALNDFFAVDPAISKLLDICEKCCYSLLIMSRKEGLRTHFSSVGFDMGNIG